jgi:hypothetical protein
MLASSALVIAIFVGATLRIDLGGVILLLFLAAMALLVAALVTFLRDIWVSLTALRLEVREARESLRGDSS